MGWVVQINPTAPAYHLSLELADLLRSFSTDFELIYCYIEEREDALEALRGYSPVNDEEQTIVRQLINILSSDEEAELLFGY